MSIRLYVGNLPKETVERQSLEALFAEEGKQVSTKVIKDRKTGKCRGFAFVTVPSDEFADAFIEKYNGQSFMDTTLKIEKALPRTKTKSEESSDATGETVTANTSSPSRRKGGSGSGANKRSRRQSTSSNQPGSIQPDPRWADELAKLKEMLAAQTSNP